MGHVKFSPFDLFAYLASGTAVLLAFGVAFTTQLDTIPNLSSTQLLIFFALAYIAGHVVSIPANILMEEMLLGYLLGRPSTLLFLADEPAAGGGIAALAQPDGPYPADIGELSPLQRKVRSVGRLLRRWKITEYGDPLDPAIVKRVVDRFAREKRTPRGPERYWAIYPAIFAPRGKSASSSARIERFSQLHVFARNLATVTLLFPLMLGVAYLRGVQGSTPFGWDRPELCVVSLLLAVLLTLRFIKFYYLSTMEMFIVYSQGDPDDWSRPTDASAAGDKPRDEEPVEPDREPGAAESDPS